MNWFRVICVLSLLCWSSAVAARVVGNVTLPSDTSVTLTASPTEELKPGQRVTFTISVTNHGPEHIDNVAYDSSDLTTDLFYFGDATFDCKGMTFSVGDGGGGPHYTYTWLVGALEPQQTRQCHLTLSLSAAPPAVATVAFLLNGYYIDQNPLNDTSSVTLTLRGQPQAPTSVPTLSPASVIALFALLMLAAQKLFRAHAPGRRREACKRQT